MTEITRLLQVVKKEFHLRRLHSWSWSENGFEKTLSAIRNDPDLPARCGTVVWKTRSKRVYRLELPPEQGEFPLALKIVHPKRKYEPFTPRFSPVAREMINFRIFEHLGVPMVHLLAGGDERNGIFLHNSWMISRFADGYRNGLDFMPSPDKSHPPLCTDPETRHDFLAINLPVIAHLHEAGCFHRAFRPYNILMKRLPNGKLDCIWLDVASCSFRKRPPFLRRKCSLADLQGFFACMFPTEEEARFSAALYQKEYSGCGFPENELFKAIFPLKSEK